MQVEDLLIKYFEYRCEKLKSVKNKQFVNAQDSRSQEIMTLNLVAKKIFPEKHFVSFYETEKIIKDWFNENFNCNFSDAEKSLIHLRRIKNIKELRI